MNSIVNEEVTTALVGLIVLAIGVASVYLRNLMRKLDSHMTPNGGKSFYDQLVKLTADVNSVKDEVRGLKDKVDAVILSAIPKG